MKEVKRECLRILVVSICLVTGIMIAQKENDRKIFDVRELSHYQLIIANEEILDATVVETVLSYCDNMNPYQQRSRGECVPKLGETLNVENSFCFRHWISENEYIKYFFWFFEAEKQLAIDYVHRDAPLIQVQIMIGEEKQSLLGGTYDSDDLQEAWYCKMSAEDYAQMLNLIRSYVD